MSGKPNYHGLHEYSHFSASTIRRKTPSNPDRSKLERCCCFLCRLSSSLIFHPVGPFRCCWDMFVMLLIIYTSIEIPFTISFGQSSTTLYISLCVDIFLLIDIFLNFHTAYFDKYDGLRLVTNKKYICKKYFRTWFLIDFVTCIPLEIIDSGQGNTPNVLTYIKILRLFRLLRIIKILRFFKMLRIFDGFMKQFIVREVLVLMKLFKIICGMLMFAHFAACLWWFVGSKTSPSWIDKIDLRGDEIETFTKYSYAWYWAVVTLFTTGYGDIVATNTSEQWVCSICILIGTCFFAYFVGTLTVLITEGDKIKSYESDKLEEAQSFCEKKKLPKELTHAILTHIRYHFRYNYVFDEAEILNLLPSYLQNDIHSYVSKQFLLQLPIFQNEYIHLPEFIIGLIAIKTKSISCNQSFKLYDVGDIAKEFYIQRTGKSTLYDKNGQVLEQLCRGSVCGEYSSILFKKRKSKIECETWSEFYSISIDDIKQILDLYYPKSAHSKWQHIKKYVKAAYKKKVKHCVKLTQLQYNEGMELEESVFGHSMSNKSPLSHSVALRHLDHTYDSSIHLFDNTRNRAAKPMHLPTTTLPYFDTSAIPPESDNEDLGLNNVGLNLGNVSSNVSVHSNDSEVTDNHKSQQTLFRKSTLRSRIAKFKIRTNSEVRNVLVVAHGEKHNKLSIPKLQKYKTAPDLTVNIKKSKQSISAEELLNIINISDTNLFVTETEMGRKTGNDKHIPQESESDSECSFSSISTDSSYEEQNAQFMPLEVPTISMPSDQDQQNRDNQQKRIRNKARKKCKNKKAKVKKKKKSAVGKFKQNLSKPNWKKVSVNGRISSCESLVILDEDDSFADSQNDEFRHEEDITDKQLFMQSIKSGSVVDP